jgi:hypothetical protein
VNLLLDPLAAVRWIMELLGIRLPKQVVEQLSIAVSEGIGVARKDYSDRRVFAVLASLLEAEEPGGDFCPTFVAGEVQSVQRNRKVRERSRVIRALQQEERVHGHQIRPKRLKGRIPVPANSTAIVPLGGDIGDEDIVGTTEREGVRTDWYTLNNVPTGGIIYRVNADYTVILYQKLADNAWVRVAFDGSSDVVNLPRLLAAKAGRGNRFTRVKRIDGPMPLIRPLPPNYVDPA